MGELVVTDWTLVTVTYNSEQDLRQHWGSQADRDFTWVVVDNGSSDGTVALAGELADACIVNTENTGFSSANNLGLQHVQTRYVGFVNPDVSVEGSWMSPMEDTIRLTQGLVAPQLVNPDGTEQPNARGLPYLSAKIRNRTRPESYAAQAYARVDHAGPTHIAWAMGAAVCAETEVFRALGGWNDDYFLYYEDHELGLRAWKQGLSVTLDPRARWTHAWRRATTQFDLAAWRREFGSMSTFYRSYPEFIRMPRSAGAERRRLAAKGYGDLFDKLWRPVGEPGGRS